MGGYEFRRIDALPPYVFARSRELKLELRRAGEDVIDLGFGNPDLPRREVAVEKLAEAARNPRNHRYSASRGIPKLRAGGRRPLPAPLRRRARPRDRGDHHDRREGGASSHLMWVLLEPGDAALVPEPELPDPHLAPDPRRRERHPGARWAPDQDFFANLARRLRARRGRGRACIVLSFPHNPTTAMRRARLHGARSSTSRASASVLVVHDFAYADLALRRLRAAVDPAGRRARSDVAVELYTLTKSFSMAGWRVGFLVGNAEVVGGARAAQVVPRLRHLPADPDRRDRRDERGAGLPRARSARSTARGATRSATGSPAPAGRSRSRRGTMFVWAPDPRAVPGDGLARASPSCSPARRRSPSARASASAPDGDGYVRFALVENEQRIGQAVRSIRRTLTELG